MRRQQNGLERVKLAHKVIEESDLVEVFQVSQSDRYRGWDVFTKYSDKVISFTDCVCFAMMHELGIYQAFSFDSDFFRAGFVVKP